MFRSEASEKFPNPSVQMLRVWGFFQMVQQVGSNELSPRMMFLILLLCWHRGSLDVVASSRANGSTSSASRCEIVCLIACVKQCGMRKRFSRNKVVAVEKGKRTLSDFPNSRIHGTPSLCVLKHGSPVSRLRAVGCVLFARNMVPPSLPFYSPERPQV